MKRWPAGLAVVLAGLGGPSATADPGQMPDLSSYIAAKVDDYMRYYNYPGWVGVQFLTPGGYRCRLIYNLKPNASIAECWGSLPATSFNVVTANNYGPTKFDTIDLAKQEEYRAADGSVTPVPIRPEDYKLLPAGTKITAPDLGTCAVTSATTTCEVADHGFVLDPQGNQTF